MGKKIDKNKLLNNSVHIRFDDNFLAYLQRISKYNNLNTAKFCREILMQYAPQYDPTNKVYY